MLRFNASIRSTTFSPFGRAFAVIGLQTTDWLGYLGFQRNDRCSFTSFQRCYSKWPQPEGWGFYNGKPSGHSFRAIPERQAMDIRRKRPEYESNGGRPFSLSFYIHRHGTRESVRYALQAETSATIVRTDRRVQISWAARFKKLSRIRLRTLFLSLAAISAARSANLRLQGRP